MESFREFLTRKKLEYMVEIGNPYLTDAEYAEHLTEVLQETPEADTWRLIGHRFTATTLNRWILGQNLPVEDNLWAVVAVFGEEVCPVLGIPRIMPRDPDLRRFIELWLGSSEAKRRDVMEFAELRFANIPAKVTPEGVLDKSNG